MRLTRWCFRIVMIAAWCSSAAMIAWGAAPLTELRGIDFQGGAQKQFGASKYGREGVNYVYAQPTGAAASMTAAFSLAEAPSKPMFLLLEGCDDDDDRPCDVEIALNGKVLHAGPSGFPNAGWEVRRFSIPEGTLKSGGNELRIANRSVEGAYEKDAERTIIAHEKNYATNFV